MTSSFDCHSALSLAGYPFGWHFFKVEIRSFRSRSMTPRWRLESRSKQQLQVHFWGRGKCSWPDECFLFFTFFQIKALRYQLRVAVNVSRPTGSAQEKPDWLIHKAASSIPESLRISQFHSLTHITKWFVLSKLIIMLIAESSFSDHLAGGLNILMDG